MFKVCICQRGVNRVSAEDSLPERTRLGSVRFFPSPSRLVEAAGPAGAGGGWLPRIGRTGSSPFSKGSITVIVRGEERANKKRGRTERAKLSRIDMWQSKAAESKVRRKAGA